MVGGPGLAEKSALDHPLPALVSEKETVGQYICKFFSYALRICFSAPLKALEKFTSFDRNALGEVFRSVELRPVAFSDEFREGFVDGLANHWVQS